MLGATRAWLLFVARRALSEALGVGCESAAAPVRPADPALDEPARAFVSWHQGARLVGCIGTLAPRQSLEETVRGYAVQAGLHDPRTPPARAADLPDLRCEISILSEPVPMNVEGLDAITAALVPGRDGLVVHDGTHRAVFLPVVWEALRTPTAFVDALCRKAGIDRARRGAAVRGETFVAEKFAEPGG